MMSYQYLSSNGIRVLPGRPTAGGRLAGRLRQAWARWRALRLARDISAACADLDRHTREDLGVDRRRS